MPNNYRVVQWNTGNVGKSSLKSIVANPTYELVGCYAWSAEKVGRDAGELVGIPPLGVAATNDVDALLALKPDCVVYNPMWIDVDELVRILSAGVNVVTTASFITGGNLGAGREKLSEACEKGGATIFGSGVSPGFAELLAIVSAMVCNRIDKVTVNEAADTTFYDSPETEKPVGFGQPIDHPELQAMAAKGTAIFGEAVRLVGDALGVELDEVRCVAEFAQTTADLEMASWTIPAGCVAGRLHQLAGRRRRHHPDRPECAVAQGADARARLEDRTGRLGHPDRRAADGDHQGRLPAAAVLRGHDDRGVHGPGSHHDGDARDQRDPGRRRGGAGHRHLHRSSADAAAWERLCQHGAVTPQHILRVLCVAIAVTSAASGGTLNSPAVHADPCPAVEVAFARGTGQPPGVGNVGQAFVDSLGSQISGRSMGVYPVNYPATEAFAASAQNGADDLVAHVQDMMGRCPNTRMVLGGFSQGAGVIDLATPAMPPQAADHVAAIAVFGNPTSALANRLSGAVFPPIGPPYAAKTIDMCADGDPACSSGSNINVFAHASYVQSGMTAQAANFVAARL